MKKAYSWIITFVLFILSILWFNNDLMWLLCVIGAGVWLNNTKN